MTPRPAFAVLLLPVLACAPASPRRIDFGPLFSLNSDSCYALAVGPWSGSFPSGWPEVHQPPDTFALTSHGSSWGHGYFEVRPGLAVLKGNGFAMWKPISADSLTIAWSSGQGRTESTKDQERWIAARPNQRLKLAARVD